MVLTEILSVKQVTARPQINVVTLFGLVSMVFQTSALTQLYTDGDIHVSWLVPHFGDQPQLSVKDNESGRAVNSSDVPLRIPENANFCEFGKYGLEVKMPGVIVTRIGTDTVIDLIKACENLIVAEDIHRKILDRNHRRHKRQVKIIYPGTEWCGTGDRASNYNDLGKFNEVDACCREHDHCPDYIPDGGERGGLQNDRGYTLLSCACDEKFRKCLYSINNFNSNTIGFTYFNVLGNKCFEPVSQNSSKSKEKLRLFNSAPYVPCFSSGFFRRIFDNRNC